MRQRIKRHFGGHDDKRRSPQDPFDLWLRLVVEFTVVPALDMVRAAWNALRGDHRHRRHRRGLRGAHRRRRRRS